MAGPAPDPLRAGIARYYTGKLKRHGATPRGVDWTDVLSQELRFVQLLKLCDFSAPFSLNDVGCGYGALIAYLQRRHGEARIDYLGVDLADAMIAAARRTWRGVPWARFAAGDAAARTADYSVASGIFNVKLEQPAADWETFIAGTLDGLNASSRRGFAVNFMRTLDDVPAGDAAWALYRTDPEPWIDLCRGQYGATVTLLEDYGQPEFTLLVRPA
jgi:SAM-dependent methyltransferase